MTGGDPLARPPPLRHSRRLRNSQLVGSLNSGAPPARPSAPGSGPLANTQRIFGERRGAVYVALSALVPRHVPPMWPPYPCRRLLSFARKGQA